LLEPLTLPSGLRILVEEAPWLQGVSLGLYVPAGVVQEPPGQAGIAHLLEHLVFRGTAKFAGDELSERIEEDGGELNAYTTKEYTCLWGRTLPCGVPAFLEMLAELFLRPRLGQRDLRREVDVIVEEYELWLQSPEEYVCDLLEAEVFRHHALSRSVLGEPDDLRRLRAQDVRGFHARHWRLEGAVLALAGPIDREAVGRLAAEHFPPQAPAPGGRRGAGGPVRPATPREARATQVHVAVGAPARPYGDPALAAQEMLVQEFGGGPNARLFLRLREELALSYGVYSYDTAYRAGGLWGAYADLPADALREGLLALREEAQALRRERWQPDLVERLRRSARGAFLLGLDSPFARVEREALQLLQLGRRESIEDEIGRIAGIGRDELRREAQSLLEPDAWQIVALHPERGLLRGRWNDVLEEVDR